MGANAWYRVVFLLLQTFRPGNVLCIEPVMTTHSDTIPTESIQLRTTSVIETTKTDQIKSNNKDYTADHQVL